MRLRLCLTGNLITSIASLGRTWKALIDGVDSHVEWGRTHRHRSALPWNLVAVWHGTYNLFAATGDSSIRSAVITACVIVWAVAIARRSHMDGGAGNRPDHP